MGCALLGIVILCAVLMAGVAAFLPPFSVGQRLGAAPFTKLNAQSPSISAEGIAVSVDPAKIAGDFSVRLRAIGFDVFSGQKAPESPDDVAWIKAARAALPASLTPLSSIYVIEKQGDSPESKVSVALPPGADSAQIDLYQYDQQLNRWLFVPSHFDGTTLLAETKTIPERLAVFLPSRSVPIISVVIEAGQENRPGLINMVNVIHPAGLQPALSGALQGVLPAGVDTGKGYGVVPVIRNFANPAAVDVATITQLLQNAGLRAVHIDRLVDFASSKPYQGLAIDYRRLPPEQRENFTAFITALSRRLRNANMTLTVVIPFPTQQGSAVDTGAYDVRAIGSVADAVQVMLPLDPQTFVDKGMVGTIMQWLVGEINRAKLQVGLSVLSVQQTGGSFSTLSYPDAMAPLGRIVVKPGGAVVAGNPVEASLTGYIAKFPPIDSASSPAIQYFSPEGSLVSTVWPTTGAVIGKRLERATSVNVAGALLLDIAASGVPDDMVTALAAYKVNQTATTPTDFALKWTVRAKNTVLAEQIATPGVPFVYKTGTDNIDINVEVVGAKATLGPVNIRVIAGAAPSVPQATPTAPPAAPPAAAPTEAATAAPTAAATQ